MSRWEPYFRPTRRVHDSGYRCFECGYLVIGEDSKAAKKVIVARGVDHITNWLFSPNEEAISFDMDLLRDGNIRIFNHRQPLFWNIPGLSDASITNKEEDPFIDYDNLEQIWEKRNRERENEAKK